MSENTVAVAAFLKHTTLLDWTGTDHSHEALRGMRGKDISAGNHDARVANFVALKNHGIVNKEAKSYNFSYAEYMSILIWKICDDYADYDMMKVLLSLDGKLTGKLYGEYYLLLSLRKVAFEKGIQIIDTLIDLYADEFKSAPAPGPEPGTSKLVKAYSRMAITLLWGNRSRIMNNAEHEAAYINKLMNHPRAPHNLYPGGAEYIAEFLACIYINLPDAWVAVGFSINDRPDIPVVKYIMMNIDILTDVHDDKFERLINRMAIDKLSPFYKDTFSDNVFEYFALVASDKLLNISIKYVVQNAFTDLFMITRKITILPADIKRIYGKCMKIFYMFVNNGMNINHPASINIRTGACELSHAIVCAAHIGIDSIEELILAGFNVSSIDTSTVKYVIGLGHVSTGDTPAARLTMLLRYGLNPYIGGKDSLIRTFANEGKEDLVRLILSFNPLNTTFVMPNGEDGEVSTVLDSLLVVGAGNSTNNCIAMMRESGAKLASEL